MKQIAMQVERLAHTGKVATSPGMAQARYFQLCSSVFVCSSDLCVRVFECTSVFECSRIVFEVCSKRRYNSITKNSVRACVREMCSGVRGTRVRGTRVRVCSGLSVFEYILYIHGTHF